MAKQKATTWNRKDHEGSQENLAMCLVALVHRAGQVTLGVEELEAFDGTIGLRARYEDDGSITLWTYDVVEDIKKTAGRD